MLLLRPNHSISALFILLLGICLSACNPKSNDQDNALKHQFKVIDSLFVGRKADTAATILTKIRPQIKNNNPLISTYYRYLSEYSRHRSDTAAMVLYADSAVNFFLDAENAERDPDEYFKALLVKGDANYVVKEYSMALANYDKAKKLLSNGRCDDGNLVSKIADIYFGQENYRMAGKYWAESYAHLQSCQNKLSPQKLFYSKQGVLDNAGIAYEKANMLDSAAYYYNLDLALINKTDSDKIIDPHLTRPARIVLYDNLGGLYLNQGNLDKAAYYLSQCVAIPTIDIDGTRISSFIKLAQLHLIKGNYDEAQKAFQQSRLLLNLYSKKNTRSEIYWNKLYAQYLFTQHQPEKAYLYQSAYIRLKDSLDSSLAKLHKVDIEQELNSIHQQTQLSEMKHQSKLEKLYIGGITIAVILSIAISLFINRILKESRKNHQETKRQNAQLQQTLAELENANKNFIRIMRIMAHDMRTPLSGMIGLATALLEGDLNAENRHMAQLIETTGLQSLEMINELLKSGLADENELIVKQLIDMKELVGDSVELLQFKADEKQQKIIFENDGQPAIITANYEKMWRVLSNLIVNAIKFSHTGGTIKVGLYTGKHKTILISVADNGIGIPAKDKDKIFEIFTEAKRPGTDGEEAFGLGLSISKKIMEKHNGRIWFESTPDVGTTFYIELPL